MILKIPFLTANFCFRLRMERLKGMEQVVFDMPNGNFIVPAGVWLVKITKGKFWSYQNIYSTMRCIHVVHASSRFRRAYSTLERPINVKLLFDCHLSLTIFLMTWTTSHANVTSTTTLLFVGRCRVVCGHCMKSQRLTGAAITVIYHLIFSLFNYW